MGYRLLLFIHVFGAIAWFGAGLTFQIASERALAGRDRARAEAIVRLSQMLGSAYFGVASGLVLLAGIVMTLDGWGFDEPFVIGGIIGFIASSIVGGVVLAPTGKKLEEAVATSAPDEQVFSLLNRMRSIGRLDTLVMTTVVFLMTVKPGS